MILQDAGEARGRAMGEAGKNTETRQRGSDAREVVEVDVERLGEEGAGGGVPSPHADFGDRLWRRSAPVLLALFLDAADLLTAGPLGLIGLPLGMLAGHAYAGLLGAPPRMRTVITALTGVYFMTPLTGLVPLAAITAMVVQIIAPERLGREPSA